MKKCRFKSKKRDLTISFKIFSVKVLNLIRFQIVVNTVFQVNSFFSEVG